MTNCVGSDCFLDAWPTRLFRSWAGLTSAGLLSLSDKATFNSPFASYPFSEGKSEPALLSRICSRAWHPDLTTLGLVTGCLLQLGEACHWFMGCMQRGAFRRGPAAPLLSYAPSQLSRPLSNQGIKWVTKRDSRGFNCYNLARRIKFLDRAPISSERTSHKEFNYIMALCTFNGAT